MTEQQKAPAPPAPAAEQAPPSLFSRVPTHVLSSAAVLVDAVALAAFQTARLGSAPFSLQLVCTFFVLPWLPYLHRSQLLKRAPRPLVMLGAVAWTACCVLPAFCALLVELFTGHRRAGATWLSAVWRVYAIMALWVLLALFNERVIRPWWMANSDSFLEPFRRHSVSAQAHTIAVNRRASVLDSIMQEMVTVSKRKILTSRTLDAKKKTLQQTQNSVDELKLSLAEHKKKVQHAQSSDEKQQRLEQVQQLMDELQEAVTRVDDVRNDILVLNKELHNCEQRLQPLQHRWEQSLHIENHTRFYR